MPIVYSPPPVEVELVETPVAGTTSHTLTTPDGIQWDLSTGTHLRTTVGRTGFDSPAYQVFAAESPGFDGEEFLGARALARDLLVPVFLRGDTREDFLALKRSLLAAISPRRGLCQITIAEADGSRRRMSCYSTGRGSAGSTSRDQSGRMWARYTLEMRAPDPYWRGDVASYAFANPGGAPFLPGLLPIHLTPSSVFGVSTITVPGDVDAYPLWTVHGPASGTTTLSFTTSAGQVRDLLLDVTLAADEWIEIDTTPTRLSVVDNTGANRFGDLADGSGLWPIPPGRVEVNVAVAGAASATRVTLAVEPRYETA